MKSRMQLPSGIIGAEYVDLGALSGGRFDRDLQKMCSAYGGEADASFGIGAGDVEVAQRAEIDRMGGGDVPEHPLGHQLGGAIRRQRTCRRMFGHRNLIRIAVDRSRR